MCCNQSIEQVGEWILAKQKGREERERQEPVCPPKGGCNHVFCMEMPFAEGRAAARVKGERRMKMFAVLVHLTQQHN